MLGDNPYTRQYYEALAQSSRVSAEVIVPLVLDLVSPRSVVDIGCGIGDWLAVFKDCGIHTVLGVDGEYIEEQQLQIERHEFVSFDLTQPLHLDRVFDLVMSVEVAEHLPSSCAEQFVDSLIKLGPIILFSAAIPLQGGEHHVNEQWPDYWARLFGARGYVVVDCLRRRIWNDHRVAPWYAQNLLLFVRAECLEQYPNLAHASRQTDPGRLALVHPWTYRSQEPQVRDDQTVYHVRIEVTEPIGDIAAPPIAERLRCAVELEGDALGTLDLPIFGGLVASYVLTDAIAARFAWPILGRFFARSVYRELAIEEGPLGVAIRRGDLLLATGLSGSANSLSPSEIHDRVGWTVLLQELWARPSWPVEYFYDPDIQEMAPAERFLADLYWVVEISDHVPDLEVAGRELDILLTIGGVALGVATLIASQPLVRAQELRAWSTIESGYELCCVAVREGLLGRPLGAGPVSLRERLRAACGGIKQSLGSFGTPSAPWALDRTPALAGPRVVFGRRGGVACGTSASRRTSLPVEAVQELFAAAVGSGDPIAELPRAGEQPRHVVYVPELISGVSWHLRSQARKEAEMVARVEARAQQQSAAVQRAARRKALGFRQVGFRPEDHERLSKAILAHAGVTTPPSARRRLVEQLNRNGVTQPVLTSELPILKYARVAPEPGPATARYQVTPAAFEAQLCWLRDAGYYSVGLEQWRAAMVAHRPLPGRAVVLTFDAGYQDFLIHAWPRLKHYGFSALVLLNVDAVGKTSQWDRVFGEYLPTLGWAEILQLQQEGVDFGSLSASYYPLTALSFADVVREAARARTTLERALASPIRTFAYPYGDTDEVVAQLIGGCGYVFGLSIRTVRSTYYDSLLALPRIEVSGFDDLAAFVTKLGS